MHRSALNTCISGWQHRILHLGIGFATMYLQDEAPSQLIEILRQAPSV